MADMLSRRGFLTSAAVAAPAIALRAQQGRANGQAVAPAACDEALPAPIAALADRRKEIVPITVGERNARLDRARALMTANKIDAIVITTGASLEYYTGARWGQSERLFAYVLPRAASPFLICPAFERDRAAELLNDFPDRESTLTYFWQENESPFDLLRRALGESAVKTGTLGIEEHTQFEFSYAMAQACPALTIASATPVTAGCRMIKSAAELALLQLANEITLSVYRAVHQSCGPGDTNRRVTELIDKAYARCGVRGEASLNVGPYSAVPHGSSQVQVIREGDIVMVDDGCTCDGYTSDITRSWVYGKASDEQKKVFEIVHRAQSAALAAARPGVEAQSVDAAARKVIVDAGFGPGYDYFTHRLGHGIGLDMHEWPYLVGGDTKKLETAMVFSDEPGIYQRGKFGIRLEDDMHITGNGAELFTPQSVSLEQPFGNA
ncbi:MAG TPA: Xaa-Pro peptidase family protein [Candidatus Aquilonibacter sp.]|nr:Xaa-Pro peptidase family protein [Candidatus Aquilonibacter sp.]